MRAIKSPLLVLFIFERHYHSDHTPCENVLNNTMAFAGITNTNPGVPAMQELPHRCIKGLNIIMGRMRRTLASAVYISTLLAAAVLWPTPLLATNYTVKSGGGGNFTTIQACANVAVAGDTCTVYAGSYAGWTQSTNGTPGNLITFTVNRTTFPTCALTTCSGPNGDVATITSGVNISGRSYIRILGFSFTSGITMDTSSSHNQIEYNSSTDIVFISLPANPGRNGSDNIVSYNKISYTPLSTPKLIGIILRGDRNLIEHNDIGFGAGDCMELGGANIVVRNNVCHDK